MVLWIAATFVFSRYLSVADPGGGYGALGGALILLLFLYVSSVVLPIGVGLNAVLRSWHAPAPGRTRTDRRCDYARGAD